MKNIIIFYTLIISLALFSTATATDKVLLDDFSSDTLDNQKWNTQELTKDIYASNGKLYGKISGNIDTNQFSSILNLQFTDPASISAMKATVTILNDDVVTAGLKPDINVQGNFYSDSYGDVASVLNISDIGGNGLECWWTLHSGGSGQGLASGTLMSNLQVGTAYTLEIVYDESQNLFTFSIDGVSETVSAVDMQGPPVNPYKTIDFSIMSDISANVTTGEATIFASVDDVYINNQSTPYDDFSSSSIDTAKWNTNTNRQTIQVENGQLKFITDASDKKTTTQAIPIAYGSDYLEMKVTVQDEASVSDGAKGMVRIGTTFYNDTYDSVYNGPEGDIWTDIRIELDDTGTLTAYALVWRTDDANWAGTTLLMEPFTTPIQKGIQYTLSVEFTGAQLLFECNGEKISYPISTPVYKPYDDTYVVGTRVYLDSGESGKMSVMVDDVYIADPGNPTPDIKINGDDGPVNLSIGDINTFTISFDTKNNAGGQNGDWWIAANTGNVWMSFIPTQNGYDWETGLGLCVQMPLATFPDIDLPMPPLSTGTTTLYFAVDDNADGNLDATWVDFIEVNVQ